MRIVKSSEELGLLEAAAGLAKVGATAFLEALREGITELEVASHAVAAMDRELAHVRPGGASSSYAYCHFGEHTLTPHAHPTGRRLCPDELVALNVFPVVSGYCIELERTFVFGEATPEQQRALDAVSEAFEAGKASVKPRAPMGDLDRLTRRLLAERGFGQWIRHGTGHAHGIMIGAAGREELGELRVYNSNLFRPGMATSVEPGVYVPGSGGYRHSDVLFVTEDGGTTVTEFPREFSF